MWPNIDASIAANVSGLSLSCANCGYIIFMFYGAGFTGSVLKITRRANYTAPENNSIAVVSTNITLTVTNALLRRQNPSIN